MSMSQQYTYYLQLQLAIHYIEYWKVQCYILACSIQQAWRKFLQPYSNNESSQVQVKALGTSKPNKYCRALGIRHLQRSRVCARLGTLIPCSHQKPLIHQGLIIQWLIHQALHHSVQAMFSFITIQCSVTSFHQCIIIYIFQDIKLQINHKIFELTRLK